MPYCTIEDIEKQLSTAVLIQLSNDYPEQNTVDNVVCEEAIIYSSSLIDGYLRGRYTLPLNTHFPLLRVIGIDLSIYRLYSRRIQTEIPDHILENYKNAIKTLEGLKKGVITLESEDEQQVQSSGEYRTNKTPKDRLFNKRKMNEY